MQAQVPSLGLHAAPGGGGGMGGGGETGGGEMGDGMGGGLGAGGGRGGAGGEGVLDVMVMSAQFQNCNDEREQDDELGMPT